MNKTSMRAAEIRLNESFEALAAPQPPPRPGRHPRSLTFAHLQADLVGREVGSGRRGRRRHPEHYQHNRLHILYHRSGVGLLLLPPVADPTVLDWCPATDCRRWSAGVLCTRPADRWRQPVDRTDRTCPVPESAGSAVRAGPGKIGPTVRRPPSVGRRLLPSPAEDVSESTAGRPAGRHIAGTRVGPGWPEVTTR